MGRQKTEDGIFGKRPMTDVMDMKVIPSRWRNSTYTKELIAHRFKRKNSATRLTKWVYAALGLVVIGCLAYFLITN